MDYTAAEKITFATLPITTVNAFGRPTGTATGFMFGFLLNLHADWYVPALVTNRHVLNGASSVDVVFTREKGPGEPAVGDPFSIRIPAAGTIYHPNPQIDLAILPLGGVIEDLRKSGNPVFYTFVEPSLIPNGEAWKKLNAIERVVMAGYPKGLRDKVNNQPIVRSGITATHPALDFNGLPEFLVDMPCFEGCSGSPVFILEEGFVANPRTGGIAVGGNRIFFLGVQHAIPKAKDAMKLEVLPSDDHPKVIPVYESYLNLGFIIKSSALHDFDPIIQSRLKI